MRFMMPSEYTDLHTLSAYPYPSKFGIISPFDFNRKTIETELVNRYPTKLKWCMDNYEDCVLLADIDYSTFDAHIYIRFADREANAHFKLACNDMDDLNDE